MPGAKHWVFTLNNPDHNIDVAMAEFWDSGNGPLSYLVFQHETGANGTPHIQGYCAFKERSTLRTVRTFLDTAHWEIARGTPAEARAYCTKLDTRDLGSEPTEFGELPGPAGQRTDLMAIKADVDSGTSTEDLWDSHFGTMVRYHRSVTEYKRIKTPDRSMKTFVTLLIGPTGTGKSRYAMDKYPGAYYKQASQWWDGYDGQSTVVLDDFYGWLKHDEMLRIMDRYPLMVQTKGGQVNFTATHLVVTSNALPAVWYQKLFSERKQASLAFYRRVDLWIYLGNEIAIKAQSFERFEELLSKFNTQLQ